jgi:DNA-binding NtrC family response regulator
MEPAKTAGLGYLEAAAKGDGGKKSRLAANKTFRDAAVPDVPELARAMVVFSADPRVVEMAAAAAPSTWAVQNCADPHDARGVLARPGVRLVILDDEEINESTRGWLLDRIHRYAPLSLVIYVAASHDLENERRARASRVQYYTAKPLDKDRTLRVLKSFVNSSA